MYPSRIPVVVLFLSYVFFVVSGVQRLTLTPDQGTALNISNQVKGSQCKVCFRARCRFDTSLLLKENTPFVVEFDCPRPEDIFKVEIIRNIECTARSCSSDIIQTDSVSFTQLDFHRTFTWNLKASALKAIQVDFTKGGLRQISPSANCPDRHTYTLKAFQVSGTVVIGKYCRGGPISAAQILNEGSFSLDVPPRLKVQRDQFGVSVGEEIKSLAKITVSLPDQSSSIELLSPNFPESFPDDDVMEWHFHVEATHKATIEFLNVTQPRCLKKGTAAEYQRKGRRALVVGLTDTQPVLNQGDFSLTLRNCEMDRRSAGSPGLSLKLNVSSFKASSPVLCSVDLRKWKVLSLHLERLRSASECEMKMNSLTMENITVPSGSVTQLSFQDCLPQDVLVTAGGIIGCTQFQDCPKRPVPLSVPSLPKCLPAPLSAVTWALRPPLHGTVELKFLIGHLQQHLPEQPCNDSLITLIEDDKTTVALLCPQGAIQKVQIHTNISVTVTRREGQALKPTVEPMLMASLKEEIAERYIFTVLPKKDTPILLATPGWPAGMESYATVSWIVSLPRKTEAHLMFVNLSQPKCANRHTNIRVQRIDSLEEDYSRREDEEAEEVSVSENFYLNMSNCMPERGDFKVITKLTLRKSTSMMLVTIASVVAALVLLFIIVLVVVCFVIKTKKKKLEHQVSIYNPNGTNFQPGRNGFPKSREDNESHVYASIEDTLVYTHLLRKGAEMGVYTESDTYRPVTGQTETHKLPVSKDGDNMEVGVYQAYPLSQQQAPPLPKRPMSHTFVDNVIYQSQPSLEEHSTEIGPRLELEGGN
ncbi:CUB domain-containing protein 1-like [Nerophis ophidion]|uniref:CUB domain-containing protein 1-like n=1 Tax=Nerophis ophidion TaxID=159077 RepID=UPI002ADF9723|nr:CUB domain-containing protein 1-like [Nerophis ophidion]